MRHQDSISATPTETNRTDRVSTRCHLDRVDEALNQRLANTLAMLEQPRSQRSANLGSLDALVDDRQVLAHLERRLSVLQELNGQGVAVEEVGDVDEEAGCGVLIGEEAGVVELVAEDVADEDDGAGLLLIGRGRDVGVEAVDDFFVAFGSATVQCAWMQCQCCEMRYG